MISLRAEQIRVVCMDCGCVIREATEDGPGSVESRTSHTFCQKCNDARIKIQDEEDRQEAGK